MCLYRDRFLNVVLGQKKPDEGLIVDYDNGARVAVFKDGGTNYLADPAAHGRLVSEIKE